MTVKSDDKNPLHAQALDMTQTGTKLQTLHFSQKAIADTEAAITAHIAHNYAALRSAERELHAVRVETDLTSSGRKRALEHMRRMVEQQSEKVSNARRELAEARRVASAAEAALEREEAQKKRLIDDLNVLVTQSTDGQVRRLDELKQRLEGLSAKMTESEPATAAVAHTSHPPADDDLPPQESPGAGASAPSPSSDPQPNDAPTGDRAVSASAASTPDREVIVEDSKARAERAAKGAAAAETQRRGHFEKQRLEPCDAANYPKARHVAIPAGNTGGRDGADEDGKVGNTGKSTSGGRLTSLTPERSATTEGERFTGF